MTASGLRVHIVVTHLLGGGHLARMRALASALARAGHRVTLISGGMPGGGRDAGYRLVQLPAVKVAAGNFRDLLGEDSAPVDGEFKTRRAEKLLRAIADDAPQVLVVESFPFGRRALRFELAPLLETVAAMQPRPLTVCSVRDILQPRAPARDRQTAADIDAWFDAVLVHADPTVAMLGETFSCANELRGKVFYTGYVHESVRSPHRHPRNLPPRHPRNSLKRGRGARLTDCGRDGGWDRGSDGEPGTVVVSAGGGAVGFALLQTAIDARPLSELKNRQWHLLVGRSAAAAEFDALVKQAGRGITVEWARRDFADLLVACAVSVSQAGYNTALDTVAANCRAVFVPYAGHGEAEQQLRAQKFAALGRAVVVEESDLNAARLAVAIDRAARLDLSNCAPIRMDGASRTVEFIERHAPGIAP